MADIYVGSVKVVPEILPNGLIEVILDAELDVRLKLTPDQFEAVKSDVPYPDGQISHKKWNKTVASIVTLLVQDNAELNDVSFILETVAQRISGAFSALIAKKFGVNDKENVLVKTVFDDLVNTRVDEILKS